jgi:threonyl-tRNA synthetase
MLKSIGLDEDVSYRYSTWDPKNREKYIGSEEQWAAVQDTMQGILDHMGLDYELGFGEAAFYGPKLDIQIKNVFGKEDTLITIQIDFQLAERFGMVFTDRDGNRQHPIIIHRTSIGCYERTLALLIEKYAGALPLWIAPEQARILPISERHLTEAQALADQMRQAGLRVSVDDRDEKIGKKIREGQMDKLQYMLIMGDQEIEQGTISVRARLDGELGSMPVDALINKLKDEVATRRNR